MKIKDTEISFEVFPPKKDDEFEGVYNVLDSLALLKPGFISVTYGAGGSRSKKTLEIASYIQDRLNIAPVVHMTCVGNKESDIKKVIGELKDRKLTSVLALRGDRPIDMTDEVFESRDFAHASDLTAYLKANTPGLSVWGACYPEKHFEAESMESDLDMLKKKVEAGAESLISQLFLDNEAYFRFLDMARKRGINVPIHAGVMPLTSAAQVERCIGMSATSVPKEYSDIIAKYDNSPEEFRKASLSYTVNQINELIENKVDGVHIYSMNKPKTTAEIVEAVS